MDPRQPIVAPAPPPPSKAPIIVGALVAFALLIACGIAVLRIVGVDRQTPTAATVTPVRPSSSSLGPNQQRFTTSDCESGIMGVVSHERIGDELYIEVKIICEQGQVSISDDDFALFDSNAVAIDNEVPYDRTTFGDQTVSEGQPAQGWTRFADVSPGEVTLLLLGFSRTIAAVPIDT